MNYPGYTAAARVDLGAIRANIRHIRDLVGPAEVMAVVKADAYGHGLLPVARAATAAGATWLGVAQLAEALRLRAAGLPGRILAWLWAPGSDLIADCLAADIDLSVPDVWALEEVAAHARAAGRVARIHLEVDTGMGRAGLTVEDFGPLVDAARAAEDAGHVHIAGVWTHLARADEPGAPDAVDATDRQYEQFDAACAALAAAGANVEVRHIANSAGVVTRREPYDLVRAGLICYGISPLPDAGPADLGLRPALTLSAPLAMVKHLPAGHGVSYGGTYVTAADTRIGVVPLGYGDGIPRHGSNTVPVQVAGERRPIAGRVCMDQFMIDLGDLPAEAGTETVLLGDARRGEPTPREWADAIGTIDYEIVTRLGPRIPRHYVEQTDGSTAMTTIPLPDAEATTDLGRRLAAFLHAGDLVILTGGLGAGKTTLTQGIGEALEVEGRVASPTFIIAREHPGPRVGLVHVDAYRLGGLAEVDHLDLDTSLEESVTVVEWGEGLVEDLADSRLEIALERPRGGEDRPRSATVRGLGPRWADVDLTALADR